MKMKSMISRFAVAVTAIVLAGCDGNVNDGKVVITITSRASLDSLQNPGAFLSRDPWVSADGRYVAFVSTSTFGATDTNSADDVFYRDMVTGITVLVSVNAAGTDSGNAASDQPSVSGDGRFVAFHSAADDLIAADLNFSDDIFVRDMTTGTTTRVSVDAVGTESTGFSYDPVISENGNFVAFASSADDLTPAGLVNFFDNIFRKDLTTGAVDLVSIDDALGEDGDGFSFAPTISADGSVIAWVSDAATFDTVNDMNFDNDVYLRDLGAAVPATILVSRTPGGAAPAGGAFLAAISGDGAFVAYESLSADIILPDLNATFDDIYLFEVATQMTERVSVNSEGFQAAGGVSQDPSVSADGRFVAFMSAADNLAPGDTNSRPDIFVRDRLLGTTTRVSISTFGVEGNDSSFMPFITSDGRFVAFSTAANNLDDPDTNGVEDVFLRGPLH